MEKNRKLRVYRQPVRSEFEILEMEHFQVMIDPAFKNGCLCGDQFKSDIYGSFSVC